MTAYIIKSGLYMFLLYGLYWTLLRKEKLFVFNRFFLIISVLVSLAMPFISIPFYSDNENQGTEVLSLFYIAPENSNEGAGILTGMEEQPASGNMAITSAVQNRENERSAGIEQVILVIYFSGFALMLFRFTRNIFIVKRLLRIAEMIDNKWYKLALLQHKINPFSFLRTIYLNREDYLSERIAPNVLRHELEHVKQFHSRDIIFFELVHILFWFNPVLLLYKNAVRINHEYLADEAVIGNMPDIRTYANDLINFVSQRVGVPFTSGFSPSMIRLRLLMLNTSTCRRTNNFRMFASLLASLILLTVLSFRPEYDDPQNRRNKKQVTGNEDIVIEEVFLRGQDFSPLKARVVFDGKLLEPGDTLCVDPKQIKFMDILKDREATRKYGKIAKDGVIEISTYSGSKSKLTDSLVYRQIFTVNNEIPYGKISIPVSNLYSSSIWTYPVFPNQAAEKPWRTVGIMTRDYYIIRGKVVDENGEPLPGVFVTATDHPHGVATDMEGRFLLEDVKPGAMAELKAEGYEPLFFRVSGAVYTLDMTITPEKKNGSETASNISASYLIKDFTGSWIYNKKLSRSARPEGYGMLYKIHQYDGDSIFMSLISTTPDNQEFKHNETLVFNTVKTIISNQYKNKFSCIINYDGSSFTVTREMKNIITSWANKSSENISLSHDGKQLIIRTINYPDTKSLSGEEISVLVFDRV